MFTAWLTRIVQCPSRRGRTSGCPRPGSPDRRVCQDAAVRLSLKPLFSTRHTPPRLCPVSRGVTQGHLRGCGEQETMWGVSDVLLNRRSAGLPVSVPASRSLLEGAGPVNSRVSREPTEQMAAPWLSPPLTWASVVPGLPVRRNYEKLPFFIRDESFKMEN